MKKVIMLCLLALMVASLVPGAFAAAGDRWVDNGFCDAWVERYSDDNNGVTLGNNPHSTMRRHLNYPTETNSHRHVVGNSPHQRLAFFLQKLLCP